ncbi:hypothetical protein [Pseudomonas multiresinivorans]|uniref:DUF2846 domain-containing protein n=1 Tax=Pseudomonas multiresinivorans TaxID=95301 RepID=A0A7Z3GPU9_9PSED|nr:hypothetical protein [Pseudomonas multiresinivorans]QJP08373.1 hypothetical protein G4G71_10985 [Pseudomonas multiresinivorans]
MRTIALGLAISALVGCSTSAVDPAKADRVPAESLYAFQKPSNANDARIIFTRDSGLNGYACDYTLFINGTKAASVGLSETATFYVTPGPAIIGFEPTSICSGTLQELSVELKPGYAYQFRGFRNASGDPGISATGRAPYPYSSAASAPQGAVPASIGMLSKDQWRQQQLDELSKKSMPYEQYQQEYRRIMGQ